MAYYVPGNDIPVDSLPLEKLIHIIFSFTKVIDNKMAFDNTAYGDKLRDLTQQKKNYPDLKVMKYADYINMMTYDLAGGGSPIATHHTNLGEIDLTGAGKPANDFFKHRKKKISRADN